METKKDTGFKSMWLSCKGTIKMSDISQFMEDMNMLSFIKAALKEAFLKT